MKIFKWLIVIGLILTFINCATISDVGEGEPTKRDFVGQWYEGDENINWRAQVDDFRSLIIQSDESFNMTRSVLENGEEVRYTYFGTYEISGYKITLKFRTDGTTEEYTYKRNGIHQYLMRGDEIVFTKARF